MKTLKNILFHSDQEKMTEKAFTQSIAVSVIGILLCVVALCSATWAWFDEKVSSSANAIKTGAYELELTVIAKEDNITPGTPAVTANKDIENKDAENKDTEDKDTKSEATENKDEKEEIKWQKISDTKFKYTLEVGTTYTVTLSAKGDYGSNGYCKILVGDQEYFTDIVQAFSDFTFTFVVGTTESSTNPSEVTVTFELRWGTYSGSSNVSNNESLVCTN